MMSSSTSRFCIVLGVALATQAGAIKSTPVEKVVTLLKDLSEKVAKEGAKDAAEYDKFACFCKEQADEKQYAMEKSQKKIEYLKAELEELGTAKTELDGEIVMLDEETQKLEKTIEKKTSDRQDQHDKYLEVASDMNDAIDACKRAIESMKTSKRQMKGAKLDLTQVTSGLAKVVQKQAALLASVPGALALLSEVDGKGAPKFQYHSNDIIATLENLLSTFVNQKKRTDFDEFDIKAAFERVKLGLQNEMKFASKSSEDKATISQAKQEAIAEAEGSKKQEETDHDMDKVFVKRLSYECEEKAKLFDQRSTLRASELSTLQQATANLESGAVLADKKLGTHSLLQKSAMGKAYQKVAIKFLQKAAAAKPKPLSKPVAFVQISETNHQASRDEAGLERVRSFLDDAAHRTESGALSAIATRVRIAASRSSPDHYVKVRGLIKDLLDKLKADALGESDQKADCDEGIAKATHDRDEANARLEVANGKLVTFSAKKESLEDENEKLSKQITDLKKGITEAMELNDEQQEALDETLATAEAGVTSVQYALSLLEGFYGKAALLQEEPTPPPSKYVTSRDGNTVGDLRPDTFEDEYEGSKDESTGIIGILEVILSDFDQNAKQATKDKFESAAATKTFVEDAEKQVTAKTELRDDTNAAALTSVTGNILGEENEIKDATGLLDSATKALADWHTMCVKGEETYEERKAKREEEIAALKQAIEILEDWQN